MKLVKEVKIPVCRIDYEHNITTLQYWIMHITILGNERIIKMAYYK